MVVARGLLRARDLSGTLLVLGTVKLVNNNLHCFKDIAYICLTRIPNTQEGISNRNVLQVYF